MGEKNSSLTRVQPVFDYINLDIQKLNQFFSLFDKKVSITSKILFFKYGENEASMSYCQLESLHKHLQPHPLLYLVQILKHR